MLEARSHKPVMLHVATALCHCLRTEGWSACCPSAAGEDNVRLGSLQQSWHWAYLSVCCEARGQSSQVNAQR